MEAVTRAAKLTTRLSSFVGWSRCDLNRLYCPCCRYVNSSSFFGVYGLPACQEIRILQEVGGYVTDDSAESLSLFIHELNLG